MDAAAEAEIRKWVGSSHPHSDLAVRHARLHDPHRVALEVLGIRRAEFVRTPADQTADGDFAVKTQANIKALDADIAALERIVAGKGLTVDGGSVATTGRLVRRGVRR